ncbi:MAG: copper resistance protein B [Rudaea sp.]
MIASRMMIGATLAIGAALAHADEAPMAMTSMTDAMQMDDDAKFVMIKLDQLDYAVASGQPVSWEGDAWYGGDYDKIWLRAEGEHEAGRLDAHTELFWDHAFATFWDWQLGARHDSGLGRDRNWAAFGVRGMAPYWINVELTGYVGEQGRTALRWRAEYELLVTQRLILQPEIEANAYGRKDPQREIGSGVSDASFALRLRYEIRREFAPYVGVVWQHRFGDAARFARLDGHDPVDTQLVAGIRFWF